MNILDSYLNRAGGHMMSGGPSSEKSTLMYEDKSNYETYNNVLLIEDNPGDARLVELLLGESDLLNCKITNKTTLADGMEALAEGDYAAILLDLTLPDSRGFETLEKLLEKFPDNNVIVLTGLSDKSLGINAVKAGAQDFLIKGAFDSDLLAKSLRYSIERSSVLQRLEESQRIAHIGNWEYDPDTKVFTASDEVYRIFGYTARKTIFTAEHLEDESSPVYIFKQIHDETLIEKDIKKDIQIQQLNGLSRYIFIQCRINKNTRGKTVLNGIVQDITERKLAEQEMVKSQERYEDIFTNSKDAIYICTLDGRLVDFNNATAELLDYTVEELREMDNVHRLFQSNPNEEYFLDQIVNNKAVQDIELVIERRTGDKRYCMLTANLYDADDFVGYNGILRDITERKQAEELRKARDLAQQSAKMKEQFIASISHEMRTPMNAVLGMSNLLIKTKLDKEQYNYISSIKQSSEILLGIINDILEISTLENGKIKFEHKVFDLPELLDNLINVMNYKTTEKDIFIALNVDEQLPQYIIGDKLRLNQILYNLVGNAVKFTDVGSVKISTHMLRKDNEKVHIKFEVRDTGIGIPKDKLEAIFETFTRIRTKDRIYEGTGLGLSIAKNLVQQQEGRMGVESELGVGSCFYFEMTFDIADATAVENIAPADEDTDLQVMNGGKFRLLLVEDHKMNQLVARKTLERQYEDQIELTIADNGQKAIDILHEKSFDIILMDIQMPIMDGYETTAYIREKMPTNIARTPILAMTAHAHISKDEKFKEYGMDDFVLKPFEPNQLFSKIAKYTNRRDDHNE